MYLRSVVCSVLLINILFCECSNVFHESSKIVYRPDDDSEYFGYSVSLSNKRLIVGAPKARSRLRRISSGQVFKCPVLDLDENRNVSCLPLGVTRELEDRIFARSFAKEDLFQDGMWFGATVSTSPAGALFVCAPRWFQPHKDTHLLQNGMCYLLSSRMFMEYQPLTELNKQAFLTDNQRPEYGEPRTNLNYYAYGQAGFSLKVSNAGVILGAPGLVQWTGGIVEYRLDTETRFKTSYLSQLTPINSYYTKELTPDDYLGYSVESGIFERNGTTLIVAGAPRSHFGYGQVLIIDHTYGENSPLNIKYKVVGDQLGSYFGASLCCADVNGDGVVDLLVGAPNYVKKDGILHYDQGAVFVYLTKIQDAHFSLESKHYVLGSEESGARFGNSIADLGDIDGDGFNDVAIGAPWEDEGKGAVYIYRGGSKGLNSQYEQRITVAGSKTFGYSISKGIDIDGNNCSDFAVGAYEVGAAYILRCIPTVHVTIAVKVPDAMNLPLNATNFTALFCVKSTPRTVMKGKDNMAERLIKLDFTARIAIDTKQNRARFMGDTEYGLSITANSEKCDEQVVVVKPTADLSKPISIKFNLEENGLLEDIQKFPLYGARLSVDSVLTTSIDIQLRRDCGEDLICKPWLQMFLEPLSSMKYVPGTNDTLGIRITIYNKEEPAYGAKVHLGVDLPPKRLPSECFLEKFGVTCNLPAPLPRFELVKWEIELEYSYRDSVVEELYVIAILEDPFYNVTNIKRKRKDLLMLIIPEATFAVSGKALPNTTIAVTRDKLNEAGNVNFVHYFEVTNFGPSDWFGLPVQVLLPDKVNMSSQVKGCLWLGLELKCTWNLPAQVSLPIILPLRFDMGLHGKLLDEKHELNITTTIFIIQKGQNKSASITTTLVLEPAPPIWPYIVGGVAGLILLSVLILVFYKYGFFSRNRPGNFKRLDEHDPPSDDAITNEEERGETRSSGTAEEDTKDVDEPSFVTENSSFLADDSS